jgi:aminoglycoside phosphotransferase (APT) family kinase protein
VRFLAALHHPSARQRAEAVLGTLTGPHLPPATTRTLRERLGTWIRPDQRRTVARWCDWAGAVLDSPSPAVLVHGDLHGDNQIWNRDELRLVLDFENIGAAGPEGSMTWPHASAHSASTPKRQPQPISADGTDEDRHTAPRRLGAVESRSPES